MMKPKIYSLISMYVLIVAVGPVVIGCKDDVSQAGDPVDSDTSAVNDNIALNELTDDQMAALCSEMFDASLESSEDLRAVAATRFCAMTGRSAAQTVANAGGTAEEMRLTCETMVQNCESGELDTMIQLLQGASALQTEGTFCAGLQDFFGDCDATTSDMANCYLALLDTQLDQLENEVAALPACSAYTPEYFAEPAGTDSTMALTDVPFECLAVALKCPEMVMSAVSVIGM
ncbi:MAG: hypothetical protein JXX14_05395 [Deltaproteobacteria bacterium]|nr:hypothetical protein [Deltaproteobacteria bacterium]